jgi:hypothetical protein
VSRQHSMASRAARTPTEPEKKPLAGFYDDGAVLAMPEGDPGEWAKVQRSMAVAVADKALRDGCGGARTPDNPEGCTSQEHAAHVAQVLEDLRELDLVEDPLVVQRYHFGIAAGEGDG